MPATAGRVRMPANNRVHSSAALQTHGIWQSAIGYDPYAPNREENKKKSAQKTSSVAEAEPENAYASFQGLLALARISSNADEARGACKKCGRVGHLTFQCRNLLSIKEDGEGKDQEAIQAAVLSGLEKLKGERVKGKGKGKGKGKSGMVSEESSEEEESESSDSDYDSEFERAIAQKYGKRSSGGKTKSTKSAKQNDSDVSGEELEDHSREKRKRGRSKKRRSEKKGHSDSEDDEEIRRRRRKEKRRRKDDDDDSDDEEEWSQRRRKSRKDKRRRRSHRHSEDDSSDASTDRRHKRRNRRAYAVSDPDISGSDDSRVARDKKRAGKKSRKHRSEQD